MLHEEWLPVPYTGTTQGFSYEVSNLGRVRKVRYKLLKPIDARGYKRVHIKRQLHSIHSLVALMFIGPRPSGYQINHIDNNPANNCVSNLEYVTPKENQAHSWRTTKRRAPHQGQKTHFAKLSEQDVLRIRQMRAEGLTYPAIAKHFNTKQANIWHICKGRTWKHLLPAHQPE